jgi:hypothetical protein
MATQATPQATPPEWTKLVPPIFADCVNPRCRIWDLSSPFLKPDGYLYATDGAIAVRVPWHGEWTHQAKSIIPDMEPVYSGMNCLPDPISAPMPTGYCPECDGERRLGTRECPSCLGSGIAHPREPIPLAPGVLIARRYALILATHSAKLYLQKPVPGEGRIRFEFDNIQGVFMRFFNDGEPGRRYPTTD